MIITKLTYQFKKTTLIFKDDEFDPFEKTITEDTALPETIQSHVDAIAKYIVEEHRAAYEEDKRQMPLGFNDEQPEDDQEEGNTIPEVPNPGQVDVDPDVLPDEPEFENTDYSTWTVPFVPNTTIPDFPSMEQEHACWLIDHQYGETDEHTYGLDELKQDMEYHGWKISQRSIETAQKRAKQHIMGQ